MGVKKRPLTPQELQRQLKIVHITTEEGGKFYEGVANSLTNMLISPNFLFHVEYWEVQPRGLLGHLLRMEQQYRLTSFSSASRISFLLWNSAPDRRLLDVAEKGGLRNNAVLQKEIDRMLKSPRVSRGVRAFFSDMLALDGFDALTKDKRLFPKFGAQTAKDAKEQTLRTLIHHLVIQDQDYRDLFTNPQTFLTPTLAALMGVPLSSDGPNASPDRWAAYTFPENARRAGIITQPSFLALHSHPGRTSPTNRGKALRENLLCQEVPDPPPNVDFTLAQSESSSAHKTMRQRLSAHATHQTCSGCHKITDPIGLALENFDAAGGFRTTENGAAIDTNGELDGVAYTDAAGLGRALRENRSTVSCLVSRIYAYGVGRETNRKERKWLKQLRKDFAEDGHRFKPLLRRVATNEHFHTAYEVGDSDK